MDLMYFACVSNYGWGNVAIIIQQISANEVKQVLASTVGNYFNQRASLTGEKALTVS